MSSSIYSIDYINLRPITYSSNPLIFPIKTQDSIGHLSSFCPKLPLPKVWCRHLETRTRRCPKYSFHGEIWGKNTGIQFWLFDRYKDVWWWIFGYKLNLTQIHGVFNCCLHLPLVLVLKHVSFISFSCVTWAHTINQPECNVLKLFAAAIHTVDVWNPGFTTWDLSNLGKQWDKLPTSTGERRISEASTDSTFGQNGASMRLAPFCWRWKAATIDSHRRWLVVSPLWGTPETMEHIMTDWLRSKFWRP